MTAKLYEFKPLPKLGRGERPKRRSDADRVRELDNHQGLIGSLNAAELADYLAMPPGPAQEIGKYHRHAPSGSPPSGQAPCEGCETQCSGCRKITIGEAFDTSLIDFALQGAPPKESA